MNKKMQLFVNQIAKEVVHEALKQHPSAIPWFVGIYDDWTIGHLKYDVKTNHISFCSENFSERNFYDICYFISEQIEEEVSPEFIMQYVSSNNSKESGRLIVKQLIEAVTDLIMDKSVKDEDFSRHRSSNKPRYLNSNEPKRLREGVSKYSRDIKYLP